MKRTKRFSVSDRANISSALDGEEEGIEEEGIEEEGIEEEGIEEEGFGGEAYLRRFSNKIEHSQLKTVIL